MKLYRKHSRKVFSLLLSILMIISMVSPSVAPARADDGFFSVAESETPVETAQEPVSETDSQGDVGENDAMESLLPADTEAEETALMETEPVETAPEESEWVETTPEEPDPAGTEPSEPESAESTSEVTEPTEAAPEETEPAETLPTETEETETTAAETETAETAETEPAESETVETTPAESEVAETQPIEETTPPEEETEAAEPEPEPVLLSPEDQLFTAELEEGTILVWAEAGTFPADATLSVATVPLTEQYRVESAVEEVREEGRNVVCSFTFDIKILDAEGNELQPAEGKSVKVSFEIAQVADTNLTPQVYHTDDEYNTTELPVETEGETATVETDGFSYYTVEFTYGDKEYVLEGGREVRLADILDVLGLSGEVTSWEVSNPELFNIYFGESFGIIYAPVDEADIPLNQGDVLWLLSLQPFDTTEWLKVEIDGIEYEITVTDDNTTHSVPSDIDYSPVIQTVNDDNGSILSDTYFQNAHKPTNVMQSNSANTVSDFAAGLPLSTIYIDETKIGIAKDPRQFNGEFRLLTTDESIAAGFRLDGEPVTDHEMHEGFRVGYDPTISADLLQASPGVITELKGDLYEITYKDAAILPDGSRAHLKITYSNAKIAVDQRLGVTDTASGLVPSNYQGEIYLSRGASFCYGGTDNRYVGSAKSPSTTQYPNQPYTYNQRMAMSRAVGEVTALYGQSANGSETPFLGHAMDAKYQIVDDDGNPINGTFIYAMVGINLDRDPYRQTGNNSNKPLWYYNSMPGYDRYQFFSESLRINSDTASDYIYVRPDTSYNDDNQNITAQYNNTTHYYCQVLLEDGKVKFVGNAYLNTTTTSPGGGSDNSYSSGFVTLADSYNGFSITAAGHGDYKYGMNTNLFAAKHIWYRYTSSTGPNGNIQTTSEGNYNGDLNDTSDFGVPGKILDPSTYVVPEGKTVIYRMMPNDGYQIARLQVRNANGRMQEIKYNGKPLSTMTEGQKVRFYDAAGRRCTLTALADGIFTLEIPYATHDEEVRVEWERTMAKVTVRKETVNDLEGSFSFKIKARKNEDITEYTPEVVGSAWLAIDAETGEGVYHMEFVDGASCSLDIDSLVSLLSGVSVIERVEVSGGNYLWKTNAKLSALGISYGSGDDDLFVDFLNAPSAALGELLAVPLNEGYGGVPERIYFYHPNTLVENVTDYWNFDQDKEQSEDPGWYEFTLDNGGEIELTTHLDYSYELYEETQEGWQLVSIDEAIGAERIYGLLSEMTDSAPVHTFLNKKLPVLSVEKATVADIQGSFTFTVKFTAPKVDPQSLDVNLTATVTYVDGEWTATSYQLINNGEPFAVNGILVPSGTTRCETNEGLSAIKALLEELVSGEEQSLKLGIDENGSVSTTAAESLQAWEEGLSPTGTAGTESFTETFTYTFSAPGKEEGPYELDPLPAGVAATQTPGEYEFTLSSGGNIAIHNLPEGITYEVAEADQVGWREIDATNTSGTMGVGDEVTANFTNERILENLTLTKQVSGIQASRDKYFKFAIEITGSDPGSVLLLNTSNASTSDSFSSLSGTPNMATIYTKAVIVNGEGDEGGNDRDDDDTTAAQEIICDDDGNASVVVYLRHGQSIVLENIPLGTAYTVTEVPEEYMPATAIAAGGDAMTGEVDQGDATLSEGEPISPIGVGQTAISDSCFQKDTTLIFTNTLDGTVPTGINNRPLVAGAVLLLIALPVVFGTGRLRLKAEKTEETDYGRSRKRQKR